MLLRNKPSEALELVRELKYHGHWSKTVKPKKKKIRIMKLESSFLIIVVTVGHVSLIRKNMDATRMVIFTFLIVLK